MAVEINIDLDSEKAHGKIQALRGDLKSLSDDVNIDFDEDDSLKKRIQRLTDGLKDMNIDVDYKDLEKAAAIKAALAGDIETKVDVDTDEAYGDLGDGLDPPDGLGREGRSSRFTDQGDKPQFNQFFKRFKRFGEQMRRPDGSFAPSSYRKDFLDDHRPEPRVRRASNRLDDILNTQIRDSSGRFRPKSYKRDFVRGPIDFPGDGIDVGDDDGGGLFSRLPDTEGLLEGRNTQRSSRMFRGLKERLKSMIPSMTTFYNLLAVIIPILVVVAAQALGVAAAMGAVAVAGASIIGLGLVGHGEDMASSMEEAKNQIKELGEEMFNVFQPTMQTFAPIQERVFDELPGLMKPVASAMEGLTVYSDTLFASLRGLSEWIAGGFRGMAAMEGKISQLALRFGELAGQSIGGFFKWLINEAYNSQEMLIRLGDAFADLISGAYHVFKAIVQIILALKPLAGIFNFIGKLLDNKVVVALGTFATVLGLTVYSVMWLTGAVTALVSLLSVGLTEIILSSIAALDIWIFKTLAATMANYGLASSIATVVSWATLGVGALLAMGAAAKAVGNIQSDMNMTKQMVGSAGGGALGATSGGTGSGTTQTVINEGDTYNNVEVSGDVDNKTEKGLGDTIRKENSTNETRKTPDFGENR